MHESEQTPSSHTAAPVAPPGQSWPQPPQLLVSVAGSMQLSPQATNGLLQTKLHAPSTQTAVPFGGALHIALPPPQFFAARWGLVQSPLQAMSGESQVGAPPPPPALFVPPLPAELEAPDREL